MNFTNSLIIVVLLYFVISIEIEADEIIQKFTFKRSNFVVIVLKQMSDIRYLVKLYNGIEFLLQTIYY